MKTRYLIRLDDASPYMDSKKWQRMEDILDRYGVKPLVGIIPANADPQTMIGPEDPDFWEKVHSWEKKGWQIALHGYDHCYISEKGMYGLNPMWGRSEFSGVSLDKQKGKIRKGVGILKDHGLEAKYFFAPSHTFDDNTLRALKDESDIRIISDTISRFPYKRDDFFFVPQIVGHCVDIPVPGIYTFCFHPNIMNDVDYNKLDAFLKRRYACFSDWNNIDISKFGKKKLIDKLLSFLFFKYRKLRKLI